MALFSLLSLAWCLRRQDLLCYLKVSLLKSAFPFLERAVLKALSTMTYYRRHYALVYLAKKGVLRQAALLKVWWMMT